MYLIINKWVITVKVSNFSGQYLRNHRTLDIGVLGYIGIVWPKEHSPEVRSFPPGTLCITRLPSNKIHREVGRAKDLSAPRYSFVCTSWERKVHDLKDSDMLIPVNQTQRWATGSLHTASVSSSQPSQCISQRESLPSQTEATICRLSEAFYYPHMPKCA